MEGNLKLLQSVLHHSNDSTTLRKRKKGLDKSANTHWTLQNYLLDMELKLFELTKKAVCKIVFQVAVRNEVKHLFNVEKAQADDDWFQVICSRHPETSLKKPDSFNKGPVKEFWTIMKAGWWWIMNLQQVSSLFGAAYRRVVTADNALSGFEKGGLGPFNRDTFLECICLRLL